METCPKCKADLRGQEIPADQRKYFGPDSTHFFRTIGLYSRDSDRTERWMCPDCGHTWDRFPEGIK